MRIERGGSIWANSTLVPSGNIEWCSIALPSRRKRPSSGNGPTITHCGLPMLRTTACRDSPSTAIVVFRESRRTSHRGPERLARTGPAEARELLGARLSLNDHNRARSRRRSPAAAPPVRARRFQRLLARLPSAFSSVITAPAAPWADRNQAVGTNAGVTIAVMSRANAAGGRSPIASVRRGTGSRCRYACALANLIMGSVGGADGYLRQNARRCQP